MAKIEVSVLEQKVIPQHFKQQWKSDIRDFTCIVMELLPAAILGTKATGVGAEGELLAELGGITVRRGTEGRPPGTTGII
jgi:hypothetical protein